MIFFKKINHFLLVFVILSLQVVSFAQPPSSCADFLSDENLLLQTRRNIRGTFSGFEISAQRADGFEGLLIDSYSSFAKFKSGLVNLLDGEIATLGSIGQEDDVQDFIVVKKTKTGLRLFAKRKHFKIEDARNEFYQMLEREALAKLGYLEDLRIPRVLAYEGNELFYEFIEGKTLNNEFSTFPFNKRQEMLFIKFSKLIKDLNSNLDGNKIVLDNKTISFKVTEYTEPSVDDAFTLLGQSKGQKEVVGGLLLLDQNREGLPASLFEELGYEILYLFPHQIAVDRDGNFYYSGKGWPSINFSSTIGED